MDNEIEIIVFNMFVIEGFSHKEIAEILKPLLHAGLTIAYESFDPTTLKNVKRCLNKS